MLPVAPYLGDERVHSHRLIRCMACAYAGQAAACSAISTGLIDVEMMGRVQSEISDTSRHKCPLHGKPILLEKLTSASIGHELYDSCIAVL